MSFNHNLVEGADEGEEEEEERGAIAIEDSGLARKGLIGAWGK